MTAFRLLMIVLLAGLLPACAHNAGKKPADVVLVSKGGEVVYDPVLRDETLPDKEGSTPVPGKEAILDIPVPTGYAGLISWRASDALPALKSFRQSCIKFSSRDPEAYLKTSLPQYGQYRDWEAACFSADYIQDDNASAQKFFESYFLPVAVVTGPDTKTGLLTGYYEPEIEVRRRPDSVYSEPILGPPYKKKDRKLGRKNISPSIAPVIAYGRPIDVFFMQIQGSGQIAFRDGSRKRAAFAAHNSQKYKSIGTALIRRGAMTKDQASKQSIESWMAKNGPQATRDLMNENPRYVFFNIEDVPKGEGPKGAMGVPLTPVGSVAIDPRYHPYGALIWLDTTLPQSGGDYTGQDAGLLVSAQDTGGAIKGPMRGDLFFGSGFDAGDRAGVMKHDTRFTIFLPIALALQLQPLS
ncbi:murein transglycosylase A [Robiginitomaculum antarcticum]|uniref:murein transglycosylase A n=1 Tax=Robiginitomaculum antarcticum TaxID=437507 RepID=UPI0003703E60|nr:MltA domain-containing protein [Robiginitomaculum antarcticum]